jgi:hypothetical protein
MNGRVEKLEEVWKIFNARDCDPFGEKGDGDSVPGLANETPAPSEFL